MKVFSLLVGLFLTMSLVAQQSLPAGQNYYDDGKAGIVYDSEFSVDFKLITPRSFGLGVNIGQLKTYYLTQFLNFEISDLRHPQEYRQSFDFQFGPSNRVARAFIFGKQNNVFMLRAGWGQKRYFSEKAKRKGLALGISYQAGPVLAFLKPYNLELLRSREPGTSQFYISEEPYSTDNADLFLDLSRIVGAAPFSAGLEDLSLMPGLNARAAAHFDWGAFDKFVKAIEAGVMIDVFLKDVPIMVEHPLVPHLENSPVFINLYLTLQLGKRR